MRVKAPWVITRSIGQYVCTRCGEEYIMALPCPISVFVAAARAFVLAHSRCKRAPNP